MTKSQQHPCYQCMERTVGNDAGCHATCERYQLWKRAYDEQQAALRKARQRGARWTRFSACVRHACVNGWATGHAEAGSDDRNEVRFARKAA